MRDPSVFNQRPWLDPVPPWIVEGSTPMSEAQLVEEQMLRAGIMASLQDVSEDPSAKVEVSKSSVSSLRFVLVLCIDVLIRFFKELGVVLKG